MNEWQRDHPWWLVKAYEDTLTRLAPFGWYPSDRKTQPNNFPVMYGPRMFSGSQKSLGDSRPSIRFNCTAEPGEVLYELRWCAGLHYHYGQLANHTVKYTDEKRLFQAIAILMGDNHAD